MLRVVLTNSPPWPATQERVSFKIEGDQIYELCILETTHFLEYTALSVCYSTLVAVLPLPFEVQGGESQAVASITPQLDAPKIIDPRLLDATEK